MTELDIKQRSAGTGQRIFVLIVLFLFVPELIVCGFDLGHFTGHDENCPFADVCHAVCDALQVVRHPQEPVCAFDGLGVLDDVGH